MNNSLIQLKTLPSEAPTLNHLKSEDVVLGAASRCVLTLGEHSFPAGHPLRDLKFLTMQSGGVFAFDVGLHQLQAAGISVEVLMKEPVQSAGRLFANPRGALTAPNERGIFELAERYYARSGVAETPANLFDANVPLNLATGTFFASLSKKLGRGLDILELGSGGRAQHVLQWAAAISPGQINKIILSDFSINGFNQYIKKYEDDARILEEVLGSGSRLAQAASGIHMIAADIRIDPTDEPVNCYGMHDVIYGAYVLDSAWRPGDRMYLKTTDSKGEEHWAYIKYRLRAVGKDSTDPENINVEYYPVPIRDIGSRFFGETIRESAKDVENGFIHFPGGLARMLAQMAYNSLKPGGVLLFGDNGSTYKGSSPFPYEASGPIPYLPTNFELLKQCIEAHGLRCEVHDILDWTNMHEPDRVGLNEMAKIFQAQQMDFNFVLQGSSRTLFQNSNHDPVNRKVGFGHSFLVVSKE